jgi:hypothetical protein
MTRVGIGQFNSPDPFFSGISLAESAMQNGSITGADLVLAFCSGGLDHDEFFRGVRSRVGREAPIIGGSMIGSITNDDLSYKGFPTVMAVIQSDSWRFRVASCGGIDRDEDAAGISLAAALPPASSDRLLLTFYDSVRLPATDCTLPVLNQSSLLLDGMESELAGEIPIFGAGLLGDYGFGNTRQFCGSSVECQHVVGCMISGPFAVYHAVMHGCTPLDGVYRKITAKEGSILYELDGRPVVQVIDDLYGSRAWQQEHPVNFLTIGVNYGERYGPPVENHYVNRLITGVTPDGKGIGMFEPGLEIGMEIQFMLRDNRTMIRSVRENSANLLERVAVDRKMPLFGIYIDCAGRTAEKSFTQYEEASEVQRAMNRYRVPLLGFYSGVEIAPLLGRGRGLDWTGVLVVFAEDR